MNTETQIVNDLFKLFDFNCSDYIQWFYNQEIKSEISESDLNNLHQKNLDEILNKQLWEQPDPYGLLYLFKCVRDGKRFLNQDVVNFYLRFLTHPSPRLDFYFKIFNQILEQKNGKKGHNPITIESEVYRTVVVALKKKIWKNELQLTRNNNENKKDNEVQFKELLAYRLNLIAEWFLRRYQIFAAFKIYRLGKLNFDDSQNLEKNKELSKPFKPVAILFLFLLLFITAIFGSFFMSGFHWISGLLAGFLLPLIILIPFKVYVGRNHSILRLLIPRQLGAIIAGYFLLIIVGSEYWDFLVNLIKEADKTLQLLLFLIPGSLLILILFYLFWEVHNQLGYYSRKDGVWRHVFPVFFIGLIETMAIGSLFFNLAGNHLQSLFEQYKHFLGPGPLCLEQLTFVATYMALTLFVGIFLQIFWQDEPITVSL